MALTGTEFMYGETTTDPAHARQAALHAVNRCTPEELPTVLSMLGLDVRTADSPDLERCRNGHARTPLNTRIRNDGTRACRPCERARGMRRRTA